ncbi:MAG: large conductance mechanosensitive channel protein MscL [Eubacteriales bacterium]|nr:large conductance mechanosensitive channel protein MscL [Lachnospiraceae bacterium]MDO5127754.1 large conductance mechanosensitive channel protein MscL [Eubacteriales bacterium]
MLKKFFKEFKEFALKGNVIDLAVGVIIGAAFQSIVTAFTECFINPLINSIGGAEVGGRIQIGSTGQYIEYGAFITAVINFLIMAFAIFMIVKTINSLSKIGKKKEEPTAPLTRKCPYCYGEIDIKATKCMHCTSNIPTEE